SRRSASRRWNTKSPPEWTPMNALTSAYNPPSASRKRRARGVSSAISPALVEPAARHFDAAVALDPARASDKRRGDPARQSHDNGRDDRRPRPGAGEARQEPGGQGPPNRRRRRTDSPQRQHTA